jgi:hypothetical protein
MTDTRYAGNIFIQHRSAESIKPEEQYFLLVSSHYRSSIDTRVLQRDRKPRIDAQSLPSKPKYDDWPQANCNRHDSPIFVPDRICGLMLLLYFVQ